MAIIAENTSRVDFKPIEAGLHNARCFKMVHIGTITENWQGQEKQTNKVRIIFELQDETYTTEDGQYRRRAIGKTFTLSMHKKSSLRAFLETWRGLAFTEDEARRFDVTKLLGAYSIISIVHNEGDNGIYHKLNSANKMKKEQYFEGENGLVEFNYDDKFDLDVLTDFEAEMVKKSLEYQNRTSTDEETTDSEEEIKGELPF
jgi:hypothetical protein